MGNISKHNSLELLEQITPVTGWIVNPDEPALKPIYSRFKQAKKKFDIKARKKTLKISEILKYIFSCGCLKKIRKAKKKGKGKGKKSKSGL